jgi:hypothetical protein
MGARPSGGLRTASVLYGGSIAPQLLAIGAEVVHQAGYGSEVVLGIEGG